MHTIADEFSAGTETPKDANAEPNFRSIADVDAYVARFGQEHTMRRVMELRLHPANREVVNAWYWWQQEKARQRSVEAAEESARASVISAEAARESVRHAGESARWSKWAVIIAVAALLVAALPYLRH